MSGLPRDVLKWLQTLDLSMTFKNPKRDFCNGYLVAEIFSRYYPSEINAKRFSNGHSLEVKLDNWSQLEMFFRRHSFDVSREAIDAIIHMYTHTRPYNCTKPISNRRHGAAVLFLNNAYTLLTNRRLRVIAAGEDAPVAPAFHFFDPKETALPHHAFPTASQLVKTIPNTEFILTPDTVKTRKKVTTVMKWHAEAIKQLQLNDTSAEQQESASNMIAQFKAAPEVLTE